MSQSIRMSFFSAMTSSQALWVVPYLRVICSDRQQVSEVEGRTEGCMHIRMQARTHTHTLSLSLSLSHTHTHTYTITHHHTHTHTHTHIHTAHRITPARA